jgi:PAS domain-containing protein/CheY-like chemotaxis protein
MKTLRSQITFLLGLTFASLLVAKTLVDTSRVGPSVAERARAEARIGLLQSGPWIERAYREGRLGEVRAALARLGTVAGPGRAVLLDAKGSVLAASDPTLERSSAVEAGLAWAADVAAVPDAPLASEVTVEQLRAAVPVRLGSPARIDPESFGPPVPEESFGALAFENDLGLRYAAARRSVAIENSILALLALGVLWVLSMALRVELERPARRITEALEKFDAGDRSARVGLKGRSEMVRIAKAFDALAERLQATEREILDHQVRLDRTLQALPMGVMVVRRDDGRPWFVNPRWRDLFGIPDDASRDILSLLSVVRCEREDGVPFPIEDLPIPAVLRTGEPAEARALNVRRDDRLVRLSVAAFPVSLAGGDTFDAVIALASEADGESPLAIPALRSPGAAAANQRADFAGAVAGMESVASVPSPRPIEDSDRDTVLAATGDPIELDLVRRVLEREGFRVLAAGDGEAAMVFFGREGPSVRAVVLDLGLRGPSGEMLLDEILALDPAARIVAVSGYRPDLPSLAASGKIAVFLTRPYREERLIQAVRQSMRVPAGVAF